MAKVFDELCLSIISRNPNMMIPWYLMASYGYYRNDQPILSDALFDKLAKIMLDQWAHLDHFHKQLITPEDLEAGTLLIRNYPKRVITAYTQLIRDA